MEFLQCLCGNDLDIWQNLLQDNRILAAVKDVRVLCQDEETESKEQLSL